MWIVLLALVAVNAAAIVQEAGRGAQISGRVTDADTGRPVALVPIHLSRQGANESSRLSLTDDDGRFQFAGLPPGTYAGLVDGRARGHYVAASLRFESGSGLTAYRLPLKEGETREVNVALTRTYAIGVRVVNEWGEPLSGLQVVAQQAERRGASSASWRHETDDNGRMRIFGLEPGRYTVCARIEGPGGSGMPARGPRRDSLLTTCYPSATEADAEVVTVERADVGELELRMRRGRTFHLSGRVVDASGAPAGNAMVSLGKFVSGGSTSYGIRIDQQGAFTATNVQPGEYAIEAELGGPNRPEHRRPYEAGFMPVLVNDDIEGLVLHLRRGLDVPGRVVLEDPTAEWPTPPGSGLMVISRLDGDRLAGSGSMQVGYARKDRTFTIERVFGPRRLQVTNLPEGWYVKSIQYDGREVIDAAVEFKDVKTPPPFDVILSNRGATLSGRIVDDAGKPARGLVLAFRTDTGRLDEPLMRASVGRNGTFRLGPTRAGTYVLVALPAGSETVQRGEWDRIARLIAAGERVTLGELEERTVDLRVVADR